MDNAASIYENICSHIVDGCLPDDFGIGADDPITEVEGKTISFAPGALDGISIYHVMSPELTDEVSETIATALDAGCAEGLSTADGLFAKLGEEYRAVMLVNGVQHSVMDRVEEFEPDALYRYAMHLACETDNAELVKFGLELLELFGEPDDYVRRVVRSLGLSDEFTLFAIWNMQNWSDGNDEIFALAKKVKGWGKVHAVEYLEPANSEILAWLLLEGIDNWVMPQYSALTCFRKAKVAQLLTMEDELSPEAFSAVSAIIAALMDEGPVAGISAVEDAEEVLKQFVRRAELQTLDAEECECIAAVGDYAERWGWEGLAEKCSALLPPDFESSDSDE